MRERTLKGKQVTGALETGMKGRRLFSLTSCIYIRDTDMEYSAGVMNINLSSRNEDT